jgi:hypothetical protein
MTERTLKRMLPKRVRIAYEDGYWKVSRNHSKVLLDGLVAMYRDVTLYSDYSVVAQCDTRCREAVGEDCECSCLGVDHGSGRMWRRWEIRVGETTILKFRKTRRVERLVSRAR